MSTENTVENIVDDYYAKLIKTTKAVDAYVEALKREKDDG